MQNMLYHHVFFYVLIYLNIMLVGICLLAKLIGMPIISFVVVCWQTRVQLFSFLWPGTFQEALTCM